MDTRVSLYIIKSFNKTQKYRHLNNTTYVCVECRKKSLLTRAGHNTLDCEGEKGSFLSAHDNPCSTRNR